MEFLSLQDVLAKVAEDDLAKAAKKVEDQRAAQKALRMQAGAGMTAGELVERMSRDDEDRQDGQEILGLPQKEKKDAPKTQRSGFFNRPPGSQ